MAGSEPDAASDPVADAEAGLAKPAGRVDSLGQAALKAEVRARLFASSERSPAAPTVGRYAILSMLGEGGMGTVYACFDDRLDRRVALKLLKGAQSPAARRRMLREAQAMARLSHPNVVPVFEVGEHKGQLFVAMEYVKGTTLARWQTDAEHGWREVLGKYLQAGRGLAAAHARGLVHRDFKPHNVMVGVDGRARVLDFGLAAKDGEAELTASHSTIMPKATDAALDTPLTETGTVMGTPAYMPPEQFMSETIDARSDQFSFCVALWEGLYGERPFQGASTGGLFTAISQGEVTLPGKTEVPVALRDALLVGLAAKPDDRWSDLDALLAELRRLDVDPAHARRRRRRLAGVSLGAVVVGTGAFVAHEQLEASQRLHCEAEATARADAQWNADSRTRVRDGLLATNLVHSRATADRVVPLLDTYVEAWRDVSQTACVAQTVEGRISVSDRQRTQWCLEQHSIGLSSLVDSLEQPDADTLTAAVVAAASLEPVDACADVERLRRLPEPPSSHERAAVTEVLETLARANVLATAKRFDDALALTEQALRRAEATGRPSLVAQAARARGATLIGSGDVAAAESHLEQAFFAARRAGDSGAEDRAATQLAYVVGYKLSRVDEGLRWAQHAEVAREVLGTPELGLREVDSRLAHASILIGQNRTADARAQLRPALEAQRAVLGEAHPSVADTLSSIGQSYLFEDDPETARAFIVDSIEIREQALGEQHPDVADAYDALGATYLVAGDFEPARDHLEHALTLRRAAFPDGHPSVAEVEDRLAMVQTRLGRLDAALALYQSAVVTKTAHYGPDAPQLMVTWLNLGDLHRRRGDLDAAREAFERLAAIGRAHGRDSARTRAHVRLGSLEAERGRDELARTHFERAVAISEATSDGPGPDPDALARLAKLLARQQDRDAARATALRAASVLDRIPVPNRPAVQFDLAQLLADQGTAEDQPLARSLARDALAGWQTPPFDSEQGATSVKSWLDRHGES